MDASAVCLKLAEHWQRAAGETAHAGLKACYVNRAARYLELAARQRDPSKNENISPSKAAES